MRRLALVVAIAGCATPQKATVAYAPVNAPAAAPSAVHAPPAWVGGRPALESKYDEFKDRTLTGATIDAGTLKVRFGAVSKGRNSYPATSLLMFLAGKAGQWQYSRSPSLIFLLDGNRLVISRVNWESSWIISAVISPDILAQIASAEVIRGQVEGDEFAISSEDADVIRQFAAAVNVGPRSAK